ncbi:MAG: hypothetical protein A3F46_10285 [Legionellales bacterium RIFCSPHIGHO2_12_FULL_42_9]|nr:MAG: hypothetical protein A3F46_10285 [Legionellales bacterium RIFCSPHIGHO2_12_FULL_42_9]
MEPTTMALVCVSVFGVIGILAAFIRQLLLSREKRLNDAALQRALQQETHELENIRQEMLSYKRYDTHYQVLGVNKESIEHIDQQIEKILQKKTEIIHRYAEAALRESSAIVAGELGADRKLICDKLKEEIDNELKVYDNELDHLQKRRASLWDTHKELLHDIDAEEKSRNEHLDALYDHHSSLLEKVFLRHTENSEVVATKAIEASTSTFRSALMAPIYFLMSLFKISTNIDPEQAKEELADRNAILKFQLELDETETSTNTAPANKSATSSHDTVDPPPKKEDIEASESTKTKKEESKLSFKSDFSL